MKRRIIFISISLVVVTLATLLLTGVFDYLKTVKIGESTFTYYVKYETAKIGGRTFVEILKEGTAIVGVYDFNAKSFDNGSIVSTVLNVA